MPASKEELSEYFIWVEVPWLAKGLEAALCPMGLFIRGLWVRLIREKLLEKTLGFGIFRGLGGVYGTFVYLIVSQFISAKYS